MEYLALHNFLSELVDPVHIIIFAIGMLVGFLIHQLIEKYEIRERR